MLIYFYQTPTLEYILKIRRQFACWSHCARSLESPGYLSPRKLVLSERRSSSSGAEEGALLELHMRRVGGGIVLGLGHSREGRGIEYTLALYTEK